MNAVTDLVIPKELLENLHMSPDEMRIEFATYLYATKRFTMGRAKRLAGLDLISFQGELAKRNIYIHYGVEDLKQDIETLRTFRQKSKK
jgi:predicted HTH domain antitoxin